MLTHPTLDQLLELSLTGMHRGLTEQMTMTDIGTLGFEERLGLLVDREMTKRADRRLQCRLRTANLRQDACTGGMDFRHRRGLDDRLVHNAYRLTLKGESMRNTKANLTQSEPQE